ncbi:MAG TPA: amidase family protein, partial [Acidiphilium sp.]
MGISYTDSERALMDGLLAQQLLLALNRRACSLTDDLAPATVFDPRLPGFAMPDPGPLRVPATVQGFPDDDTAIAFAPITAQATWLRQGKLTATRLTALYLDRIERLDPRLLCYARLNPAAREEAAALDARAARGDRAGPLHGIPYACKDIIDTTGLAT